MLILADDHATGSTCQCGHRETDKYRAPTGHRLDLFQLNEMPACVVTLHDRLEVFSSLLIGNSLDVGAVKTVSVQENVVSMPIPTDTQQYWSM